MLLVQQYLLTHSFKQLAEEHGVYPSFSQNSLKFSLNYDMIESKNEDKLAQECRGLILAKNGVQFSSINNVNLNCIVGETDIIACPFFRFFNFGQGCAAEIDFNDPNLSIQAKMDGSLAIVYYSPIEEKWCMGTRACPDADLLMDNKLFTFRTLFDKALMESHNLTFDQFTEVLNSDLTYCFELCTPYNKIVVDYKNCFITLLTARNIKTLQEIEIDNVQLFDIPKVKTYKFNNISEVVAWVNEQNPNEHEGVVIKDGKFQRLKIKNAKYVLYSKLRDSLGHSPRNCLELILLEGDDDAIPFLPIEIAQSLLNIKEKFNQFIKYYDNFYEVIKDQADNIAKGDRKTLAVLLQKYQELWHPYFIMRFNNKCKNMKDFIKISKKRRKWAANFLDTILEKINIKNN